MVKANVTIFNFYLAILDSFSEFLSQKYPDISIDNINHYKIIIIQKIARMFHTLKSIALTSKDEVSARCVLRGILDSVSVYCLIYNNMDKDEMMFRHYLYVLDGLSSFRGDCLEFFLDRENVEKLYDDVIKQTKELIYSHPYLKDRTKTIEEILSKNNWKFQSLTDSSKLKYKEIYSRIGLDDKTSKYYQSYLSQFAHGLCMSNNPNIDSEKMQKVLFESIPLADKIVQTVYKTYPLDDLTSVLLDSNTCMMIIQRSDFVYDDLFDFMKSLVKKEKILLI